MRSVALVTAYGAVGLDEDEPLLLAALRRAGAAPTMVAWDDPTTDWSAYDIAVIRSTWDYARRHAEFLAWAAATSERTRLHNPLPVLRWNTDKRYLRELAAAGVPVVPTDWLEPGERVELPSTGEYVVKPAVSAGARDTARYTTADRKQAHAHAAGLLDAGRTVMVQPYLTGVDDAGETALLFLDGQLSHAVRKGALLARGRPVPAVLFTAESIQPRTPSAAQREVAAAALAATPAGDRPLLYARVDLVPGRDGRPLLLELEVTEPSMFLTTSAGAAQRFAAAIVAATADPAAR